MARKLTPPDPVEENLYHFDAAKLESRKIRQLPGTLREALDELSQDSVIGEALGEHVFERFVEAKTEEWDEYRKQVSSWEVEPLPGGLLRTICRRRGGRREQGIGQLARQHRPVVTHYRPAARVGAQLAP